MPSCLLCPSPEIFVGINELEAHIAADHFNVTPYECEKCRFAKFPTEYAVRNHYEKDHGLSEYYIRYRISPDILSRREQTREVVKMSMSSANMDGTTDMTSNHTQPKSFRMPTEGTLTNCQSPSAVDGGPLINANSMDKVEVGGWILLQWTFTVYVLFTVDIQIPCPSLPSSSRPASGPTMTVERCEATEPKSEYDDSVVDDLLGQLAASSSANDQYNEDDLMPSASTNFFQALLREVDASSPVRLTITGGGHCSPVWPAGPSQSGVNGTRKRRVNDGTKSTVQVQCKECDQLVANYSTSLIHHVNVKHLRLPMLRCTLCDKTWASLSKTDVSKHVRTKHNGDDSHIEDNRKKYWPFIGKACDQYFPDQSGAK
jgi:hypothetical protein